MGGGKKINKTANDFCKDWSGVVLLAEKEENAGEKDYEQNKQKERNSQLKFLAIPIIILLLIATNTYVQLQQNISTKIVFLSFSYSLLKIVGVAVSVLLLLHEVDSRNPLLKQICSTGSTTNCAAILNSKQSKLFNLISWSEIGFYYFLGGLLSLIIMQHAAIPVLLFANLLAVPYTFFSIYYQWKVAKQWCVLCLVVQAILVAELLVLVFTNRSFASLTVFFNSITFNSVLTAFAIFLLPILFWFILKPNLIRAQEGKRNMRSLMRLKFDPKVFTTLLN